MSRTARYAMFALLYFAQGAVMSYFTALNALYLLSFGVSMRQIGILAGLSLAPFVIKIFLGMLSDRVNLLGWGHRKPYIVIGLLIQAAILALVPAIDPGRQFWLYALAALSMMMGMALYDTCTDGLALDTTLAEEEGTIQGIMVGGRALGVVIISGIIGLVAQNGSWAMVFWLLAVLTLLPIFFVLQVHETQRPAGQKFEWRAFGAFTYAPIITLGLLGALYSLVINAASQILNPFLQAEYHIDLPTAGLFTTVWGVGVVLGGLSGGRLTDRIGQKRSVQLAALVAMFSIAALALISGPLLAWPLVALFGLAFGYYETVYFAISMQSTDPRIAASMFSILMAIANVGTGIGLALSGALVDTISYRPTFALIAALNLLALPLLPVIFKQGERVAAPELNETSGTTA